MMPSGPGLAPEISMPKVVLVLYLGNFLSRVRDFYVIQAWLHQWDIRGILWTILRGHV